MKSFLKWPGGKSWLVPTLAPELGTNLDSNGTYYEPFCGSCAMFFGLKPDRAVLSDINDLLVQSLRTIVECPEDVVHRVWRFSNTRECYERVRASKPRSAVGAAARFVYLSRTAWGGMYRVNSGGEFNVPFGSSGRRILQRERLLDCARALTRAEIRCEDFEESMARASHGDVIYADPPYVSEADFGESVFNRYCAERFTLLDEKRLAFAAQEARERGAFVAVSGFETARSSYLWRGWWIAERSRPSNVSRDPQRRRTVKEVVFLSDPPMGC